MDHYDVRRALKGTSKGKLTYSNNLSLGDVFDCSSDCAGVIVQHNGAKKSPTAQQSPTTSSQPISSRRTRRSLPCYGIKLKSNTNDREKFGNISKGENRWKSTDDSRLQLGKEPMQIKDIWNSGRSDQGNRSTNSEELASYMRFQQLKARLEARQRRKKFETELNKINEDFENELILLDNKIIDYHFVQFDDVEKTISGVLGKGQEHLTQLREKHGLRSKQAESTVQKIAAVKNQMLIEQERAIAEENARADLLKEISLRCKEGLADRARLLDQVRTSKFAKSIPKDAMLKVREKLVSFEKCLSGVNFNEKTRDDLQQCLQDVTSCAAGLKTEVDVIEAALVTAEKLEREAQAKANVSATIVPNEAPKTISSVKSPQTQVTSSANVQQPSTDASSVAVGLFASSCGLQTHEKAAQFMKSHQDSISSIVNSTETAKRQYRHLLLKVVNTPINAISNESPSHLMDKMQRLKAVLDGQVIAVTGKQVSVKDCPEGSGIASDFIAKQLVQQGAQQVSSSHKSAFPVAAVALFLWSEHPEMGDLLLGYFYRRCPLLVPYYIPRLENQSKEDYFSLLGYDVTKGEIEEEEKFLKKLSGLVRLYAAIIQSPMPPNISGRSHPHGLQFGWLWISSILNLQPRPTVTATVLFDFLEVCGQALLQNFKKQFQKLLQVLCRDFIPKIDAVTPADQRGPVSRLKDYLERGIKTGSFPAPEGQLTAVWWRS